MLAIMFTTTVLGLIQTMPSHVNLPSTVHLFTPSFLQQLHSVPAHFSSTCIMLPNRLGLKKIKHCY